MKLLTLLILIFHFSTLSTNAQVTLISPTAEGGFENGVTFADNGWTSVNAPNNIWVLSTLATGFTGNRGAHVSFDGTAYDYNITTNLTSHFYRDVIIPAGATSISLSFQWRGNGESGWDRMLIYTAPTGVTPVANVPASNGTALAGATLLWTQPNNAQGTYTPATIAIPNGLAGTTVRLIFTWQGDTSVGTTPPAAIDNISLTYIPSVPMTYTSSTTTQVAIGGVENCETSATITKVEVVTGSGPLSPLNVSSFNIGTAGTSNLGEVSSIQIYYTGTTDAFSSTTLFGTGSVGATSTINGSQDLSLGTNYFWVVYNLNTPTTIGGTLDASCSQVVVDGVNQTPTVTSPVGNGTIGICNPSPGGVSLGLDVWVKANSGLTNQANSPTSITASGAPAINTTAQTYNYNPYVDFTAPALTLDGGTAPGRQFLQLTGYNNVSGVDYRSLYFTLQLNDLSRANTHLGTVKGITLSGGPASGTLHGHQVGGQAALHQDVYDADFASTAPAGTWRQNFNNVSATSLHLTTKHIVSARSSNPTMLNTFLGGQNDLAPASSFAGHNRDWRGPVGEVIAYTTQLSAIDDQKIHSYLGIKYGLTLPMDYLNTSGGTIFTTSAPYNLNIIGIGRDDIEVLTQKQSHQDDDSVRIYIGSLDVMNVSNSSTFLNDISYVVQGSNSGVLCESVTANAEIPSGLSNCTINNRLEREWKVQRSNMSQNYNMDIKLANCADPVSVDVSQIRFLVDDDGDFSNGGTQCYYNGDGAGTVITYSNPTVTISNISTTHISDNSIRFVTIANISQMCEIDLGNDTTICQGGSLTLDAGAGYDTYTWSNGATTQTTTVSTAGTYSVIVTEGGTPGGNLIINGNFNAAGASWSDCGNATEAWASEVTYGGSDPTNTNVAEVDAGNDGVPGTADDMLLCQTVNGLVIGQNYNVCFNYSRRNIAPNPVNMNVTIDGGALNQTVTATNAVFGFTQICFPFTATQTTHLLSFTPGNLNNSGLGVIVDDVTIIAPPVNLTCTAMDTIVVSVETPIQVVIPTNPICNGDSNGSIAIQNTLATEYSINGGTSWQVGSTFTNLPDGLYNVCSRTALGCQVCEEIELIDPPVVIASLSPDITICQNSSTTLVANATGGTSYTYNWDFTTNTDPSQTVSPTSTTTYTVYAVNELNCSSQPVDVTVTVTNPIAGIIANPITGVGPLVVDFTNTSQNATNYFWNFGNGTTLPINDLSGQQQMYELTGNYLVSLIAFDGICSDTAYLTITVVDPILPVDITAPNVFTPNGDGVNDYFEFNLLNIKELHTIILNRWGNVVYESTDNPVKWDGGDATDGVYFYRYTAKGLQDEEFKGHGFVQLVR